MKRPSINNFSAICAFSETIICVQLKCNCYAIKISLYEQG